MTKQRFQKASFWKRLAAFMLDSILLSIFAFVIAQIHVLGLNLEEWLLTILYYLYNILCDYYRQATIGKMIMKLRVIQVNGAKPELTHAFYRNIGKMVSALPFYCGFLRILAPHRRQTVHDELGKSLVIDVSKEHVNGNK